MTQIDETERNVVRDLAKRLAELAHSDENARRQKLWLDVNSLRKPERPPLICNLGKFRMCKKMPTCAKLNSTF